MNRRRRWRLALAVLASCLTGTLAQSLPVHASEPGAAAPKPQNPWDTAVSLQLATAEMTNKNNENFDMTTEMLKAIIDGTIYPHLSPEIKFRVDVAYGYAAFHLGSIAEAQRGYTRATSYSGADWDTWLWRLHSARLNNDFTSAYDAFKVVRVKIPPNVGPFEDSSVHGLEQGFGTLPNADKVQLDFEEYLDRRWTPLDPFFSRDVIWYHHAQNLLAAGRKDEAFQMAGRITDPEVLAAMLADRRFDGVLQDPDPKAVVNKAAANLLEKAKAMRAFDPKWIEAHSALAGRYLFLGRPEDTLSEINQALANAAQLSVQDRRRYDFDDQYDHALIIKAHALFGLGRQEEALGVASAIGAGSRTIQPNTDTVLLGAQFLIALGRGSEALALLSPVSGEYLMLEGHAQLAALRACGAAQTGDKAILDTNIRYLRKTPLNLPGSLLEALLCSNDIKGAASAVVAALANPRQRALMLSELQIYKPAKSQTAVQMEMERRFAVVRTRPDVIAAIDRVGRINTYDIEHFDRLY